MVFKYITHFIIFDDNHHLQQGELPLSLGESFSATKDQDEDYAGTQIITDQGPEPGTGTRDRDQGSS